MQNPSYLIRSRHHIYYFRWPLPLVLRQSGKTPFLKVSLATRDPKEALQLACILEYHASVITRHERITVMDHGKIVALLKEYFYGVIDRKKAEIHRNGPLSEKEIKDLLHIRDWAAQAIKDGADEIIPGEDMHQRLKPIIEQFDVDMPIGSADYQTLKTRFKYAFKACCDEVLAHNQKQLEISFGSDSALPRLSGQPGGVPMPENRLANVVEKFMAEKRKAKEWTKRGVDERQAFYNLLIEILGERCDMPGIDAVQARKVKDILLKVPKNRDIKQATRDKPLMEQIAMEGIETLSIPTINKYITAYSLLFKWAKKHGYANANPFDELQIKEEKGKKRDNFKPEQVALMLAELDKGEAGLADKDYKYWGALIGLYTGARLNEISSLTVHDIKQDAGVWYFDINEEEDSKRLKTRASIRKVPIHSELMRRGFLEYVARVKAIGKDTRLLYQLTYYEKEGWGRKLSRWFNNTFLVKLGLKTSRTMFHSLRHTVITNLRNARVENPVVRALVGHEAEGVTEEVYTHGYELPVLRDAIERLSYPAA